MWRICDTPQQRLRAELIDGGFVHAGSVIVTDFLRHGVACGIRLRCFLENRAQLGTVIVFELAVSAPAGLVRRDGILFHPAAAGVGVEIHTWVNCSIHVGNFEYGLGSRVLRECGHASGQRRQKESGDFPVHRILGREIAL